MPSDAARALWRALCMEADAHPRRTGRKIKLKASERVHQMLMKDLGLIDVKVWWAKGYWSKRQQDVFRWEFIGRHIMGGTTTGGCYQSMTECAKSGMKLEWLCDRHDGEIVAVKV